MIMVSLIPIVYLKLVKKSGKQFTSPKRSIPNGTKCFFFELGDKDTDVKIEVWDKDNLKSDDFLGQTNPIIIERIKDKREQIIDEWMELHPRPGKRDGEITGKIHIRYIYSTMPESKPKPPKLHHNFVFANFRADFSLQNIKNNFKTGDLILFSDIGLLPSVNRLFYNFNYSRIGIVIKMHNKWVPEDELFVFEVTRNVDKMLDTYAEVKTISGINLFHLYDRIFQYHGSAMHWCPLKRKLDVDKNEIMLSLLWEWYLKKDPINTLLAQNKKDVEFTQQFIHVLNKHFTFEHSSYGKNKVDCPEVFSLALVTEIFRGTGLVPEFGQIVNYDGELLPTLFDNPVLIKKMNTNQMEELTKIYQAQLEGKSPDMTKNISVRDMPIEKPERRNTVSEPPISTSSTMDDDYLKMRSINDGSPLLLMQDIQIKQIMQQYDKDGDEQLSYKEFSDFWDDLSATQNEVYTPEEKEKVWQRYDTNHDGQLDMNELVHIFNPVDHEDRLRVAEKEFSKVEQRAVEAERLLTMVEHDPNLDPKLKEEIVKQTLPPAPQLDLPPVPPEN